MSEEIHIHHHFSPHFYEALERLAISQHSIAELLKNTREIKHKMSEVNDKIQELVDVATDLKTDVGTLKTAVEAFIASNPGANVADLQAAIDNLKATDADVEAAIGEVNPTPAP